MVEYLLNRVLKCKHSEIRKLLQSVLFLVLKGHVLGDRLVKESLKELVVDFYSNCVDTDKLLTTAQVIQSIYQNKVQSTQEPTNPLVFHGPSNNFIQSPNNIGWVFGRGFTLAMWICFEPIKSMPNVPLGKLFTFYAEGVGGLEAYLLNEKLYYRHIGPRYS